MIIVTIVETFTIADNSLSGLKVRLHWMRCVSLRCGTARHRTAPCGERNAPYPMRKNLSIGLHFNLQHESWSYFTTVGVSSMSAFVLDVVEILWSIDWRSLIVSLLSSYVVDVDISAASSANRRCLVWRSGRRHPVPFPRLCYLIAQRNSVVFSFSSVAAKLLTYCCNPLHRFVLVLYYTGWAKKPEFLRIDNFATVNGRKTCDRSKVSEFCLE